MSPDELRRQARRAADWIADYVAEVGERPVLASVRPGEIRRRLPDAPPEDGEPFEDMLRDLDEILLPGITHWNHPAFFAYFAVTGSGPGILGEMLAAALNVNAMVWRGSPAATELEEVVLEWLRQLLGLPAGFDGVINDTASTSSLYALAAAREQAVPESRRNGLAAAPPARIYASAEAHSSIDKAAITLGLGRNGVRRIEVDGAFRMRPDALEAAVEEDRSAGRTPLAVVATAGTTSTTSVDPLDAVADVASDHDLWLHVDAAYGGAAALLPELRDLFRGWERADSIVVNPHKWLFTPIDCSALYCRRPERLRRAFSLTPEYLRTGEDERDDARNLMDYGVALGRRFRSLKLWFVLRWFGARGLRERIRRHVSLARELAEELDRADGWERMAPVPFATVVFRFAPSDPEAADRLNEAILERVNATGEAFLSHTRVRGRYCLRLSVGNLRTTRAHVRRTWERLREAAAEVG